MTKADMRGVVESHRTYDSTVLCLHLGESASNGQGHVLSHPWGYESASTQRIDVTSDAREVATNPFVCPLTTW